MAHPCASFAFVLSAESNPVELEWWSVNEALSSNHLRGGVDDLVELAEGYQKEREDPSC